MSNKNEITIKERIKIFVLKYDKYKDLIKVGVPTIFAIIALISGFILGEPWRSGAWWWVSIGVTIATFVANLGVEYLYYKIDSRDAANYSKFIEYLLKFNKKNRKRRICECV